MNDLLAALVGAVIGGAFALFGGWLAIYWQRQQTARSLALGILGEISGIDEADAAGNADQFYRNVLAEMKEAGRASHVKALVGALDNDPAHVTPVYYGNVAQIGVLPPALAREIILFYSRLHALRMAVVRGFGGGLGLGELQLKGLAITVEAQYDAITADRRRLVGALNAYLRLP